MSKKSIDETLTHLMDDTSGFCQERMMMTRLLDFIVGILILIIATPIMSVHYAIYTMM